jgi:transposase
MPLRPEDLPSDPVHLTEMVLALDAEVATLRATVSTLKDMIFGARSERRAVIAAEQLPLNFSDIETLVAPPAPANDDREDKAGFPQGTREKRNRNIGALPKHLPRFEKVIEPETTTCPCCGGKLHCIGEDTNEVLDVVPAILRILRIIRPKYACRACEGAVVQAKAYPRLIEKGMASTALVAWIATAKFAWGSALYRQVQILAGLGVHIDRSTLGSWMKQAAWWLKGLYELQLQQMHAHPRLFCDETPMPVLDPGRGKVKKCQMWAHAVDDRSWQGPAPPAVAYIFAESRGKKEIIAQLASFKGVLQVDGYAAYKALDKGKTGTIELAFCLAHARRKFVSVLKATNSPFAKEVIERIAAIYAIEKTIRGIKAEQRGAVRQSETKPLMDELHARLIATKDGLSTRSPLTAAIDYMLDHWAGLVLFLEDGRLDPDTNLVERTIRPIALGRKNSLFCGNEGGGETWAILASLVNTAKLNGLDPQTYLAGVLERIVSGQTKNKELHELLAWNWKAARNVEAKAAA